MFKELIDKLKSKKKQLQDYTITSENIDNKPAEKQSNFEITVSSENNISKIIISDYILSQIVIVFIIFYLLMKS